jgi:hypothetical protein
MSKDPGGISRDGARGAKQFPDQYEMPAYSSTSHGFMTIEEEFDEYRRRLLRRKRRVRAQAGHRLFECPCGNTVASAESVNGKPRLKIRLRDLPRTVRTTDRSNNIPIRHQLDVYVGVCGKCGRRHLICEEDLFWVLGYESLTVFRAKEGFPDVAKYGELSNEYDLWLRHLRNEVVRFVSLGLGVQRGVDTNSAARI